MGQKTPPICPTTEEKLRPSRWGNFGEATILGEIRYNFFEDDFSLNCVSVKSVRGFEG